MKCAILIRGHHHYNSKPGSKGTPEERQTISSLDNFDYRSCYNSIEENIIDPIKSIGSEVDIYTSTYESDISNTLNSLNPEKIVYSKVAGSSQLTTLFTGLNIIEKTYDFYIILRFDLIYKNIITNFNWTPMDKKVYVPWKEFHHLWISHNRIGDAIFVVDGHENFISFKKSISDYIDPNNTNIIKYTPNGEEFCPSRGGHYLYKYLIDNNIDVNFLVDGYYDTNTSHVDTHSNNPIYRMYGRKYHFTDI